MNFASHVFAAALAFTAVAASAHADPVDLAAPTKGYTYFNKPGADQSGHNESVVNCLLKAAPLRSEYQVLGPDLFTGGLLFSAFGDAFTKASVAAGLENCMVAEGWRVVRLPEAEGIKLSTLPQAELATKLSDWIGAAAPHGDVVRAWKNEAADGTNIRFRVYPAQTKNGQLSLKATPVETPVKTLPVQAKTEKVTLDPKWPVKFLKPEDAPHIPDGGGLVLFRLSGLSQKTGIGFSMMRVGSDPSVSPSAKDHAPDFVRVVVGLIAAKPEGNIVAIDMPAGHWRIAHLGLMPTLNLCMGSPAFEVQPGDVIYAGAFDMSATDLKPDLDLAPAQAWLSGSGVADRVKPAGWTNGSTGVCGGNSIYALEFAGYPFEPGYASGSLARQSMPAGR